MKSGLQILVLVSMAALSQTAFGKEDDKPSPVDDLDLVKLLNVNVSTATKTSENLDDAPAVITVVTREEIHEYGYQRLSEVLQHCVGFFVIDDNILPNVGVRGMTGGLGAESSVIKVMIDGRSVAYRTTSGNWLDTELVPLESIKQIEIIRGPASALYGADAFLGVVNIITESPDDARPFRGRLLAGATGSNPAGQIDMVGTGRQGKWDFMFGAVSEAGSRNGLHLPPESPASILPPYATANQTTYNLDRQSLGLQARIGYRDDDWGHAILSLYSSEFQRGGDFATWAQLTGTPDGSRGTVISLAQLRANLDLLIHVVPRLDVAVQGTFFEGGVLPADRIEVGSDLFYVKRNTHYRGLDSSVEGRWVPGDRFNLIAGIETVFDYEMLDAPERFNRTTGAQIVTGLRDQDVQFFNLGAYMSANLQVIPEWLKLTGGLRFDDHSYYGSQATGRIGITSRWGPNIVAKLLYGNAFKAPSPYLLYATPLRPGDVVGNPNLRPQFIHTVEYQMSWKPSQFFGVTSSLSYSLLLDEAEFVPQGINLAAQNVASQKSLSWETRIDFRHYNDFGGYLSGEVVYSTRDLGQVGYAATLVGSQNVVYPPYILRAGFHVALPSPTSFPLQLVTEGIFMGPRRPFDTSLVDTGYNYNLSPYFLWNAGISTRALYLIPGHESKIALRVKNILDARGPDPGFSGFEYPLTPREVFLEIQHTY